MMPPLPGHNGAGGGVVPSSSTLGEPPSLSSRSEMHCQRSRGWLLLSHLDEGPGTICRPCRDPR